MTGQTRPTSEQLRLVSAKTGEHILDTYLEAAEKGGRTLPDLLDDLFNSAGSFYRGSGLYNWKGVYTTGVPYVTGDTFRVASTSSLYVALRNFTASNNISQEITDNKISLIFDGALITSAQTYATNAAASATSAASSATSAQASATSAQTSATNSATSASAASGSATAAQNSATSAATSATNSASSASAAASSATSASTSASTATTQASNAAASATSASGFATTASNAATSAQTSATNAAGSATTANNAATTASTHATNAANSATSAASSATSAANSATSAASSASDAAAYAASLNPASVAITGGTITGISSLGVSGGATISGNLSVDTSTLFVDSTNNRVGVNKTTPQEALDVAGTVRATGLNLNGTAVSATATELNHLTGVTSAIQTQLDARVTRSSSTGSAAIPAGTQAQRDASPSAGFFRFNSTLGKFEGYNGSAWGSVGGGATGGGADAVFHENDQVITTSYTISSGKNAMTAGPVTISSGVSVTVPNNSVWTVI